MNNNLFYCHTFYISWKIDIFLADRLELWTSIPSVTVKETFASTANPDPKQMNVVSYLGLLH